MDAEVTSINSTATKETTIGGFALSAPNLFGNRLSAHRHNTTDPKLGEDSNGSSDPDLTQTNKVGILHDSGGCQFEVGYLC